MDRKHALALLGAGGAGLLLPEAAKAAKPAPVPDLSDEVAQLQDDYAVMRGEVDELLAYYRLYSDAEQQDGSPPLGDYVNVMDYDATGDGETDDRTAILAAIAAAEGIPVYFPAGTYLCGSTLTVPASSDLRGPYNLGPSACTAWIKGRVDFGSTSTFSDLKIGDSSKTAAQNQDDASTTTFTRCHFRGGGGSDYTNVIALGWSRSCDHISFYDCEVERNLGTTGLSGGFNNICIWCGNDPADIVTDILFEDCHVGVSNGVATGAPRMALEAFTEGITSGGNLHGWQRLTLRRCTFEIANQHCLDFSDYCLENQRSTGVLIDDCVIMGSETACSVTNEMALEFVLQDSTIYRSGGTDGGSLYITAGHNNNGTPKYDPAGECVVTGNLFDLSYDNGITPGTRPFRIEGTDTVFEGNTINDPQVTTWSLMYLDGQNTSTTGNSVTSNTVTQSSSRNPTSPSTSISSEINDATSNTLTGNDITRV